MSALPDSNSPRLVAETPPHVLLEQAAAASRRLSELVGGWPPLLPRTSSLNDAETTLEGLRHVLAALRKCCERIPAHEK